AVSRCPRHAAPAVESRSARQAAVDRRARTAAVPPRRAHRDRGGQRRGRSDRRQHPGHRPGRRGAHAGAARWTQAPAGVATAAGRSWMIVSLGPGLVVAMVIAAGIAWSPRGRAEPAAAPPAPAAEAPAPAPASEAARPAFYVRLGGALVQPVS